MRGPVNGSEIRSVIKLTLIIADDDPAMRQILRLLAEDLGAQVLAEADNGRVAIELAEFHKPEMLLLDVCMPVMGGLIAARHLRQRLPDLCIIVLSHNCHTAYAEEALNVGAKAFITKGSLMTDLQPAIEKVMSGGIFVSPRIDFSLRPIQRMLP